ncbi:MAG: hypothetical protein Q9227_001806 [Pyrenula ochraceoflavens]
MLAVPPVNSSPHETFSDYGSEPDEELVNELYATIPSTAHDAPQPLIVTDLEDYEDPRGVRLPKILGSEQWVSSLSQRSTSNYPQLQQPAAARDNIVIEAAEGSEEEKRLRDFKEASLPENEVDRNVPDTRSPLERFRQRPRKPLSVTDLVSPAWCELQYFYTLSKHGKKRRTPAMRQGSKIHQKLEDEVHVTVPVDVTTKEDSWGLRIWNIIQGLRSLRDTGVTRELEIWGLVDGEIVNGVIDELTYTCPNPTAETDMEGKQPEEPGNKLLPGQKTITDFLLSASGGQGKTMSDLQAQPEPAAPKRNSTEQRIYVIDTKTRGLKSLPTGSSLRPTHLQLHIYHHLLTQLGLGNLPLASIATRHNLDVTRPFTEAFIAQIGNLNEEFSDAVSSQQPAEDSTSQQPPISSQDSLDTLLAHNTLSALWSLMVSEFQQTLFTSSTSPFTSHISPLLTARYVSAADGSLIGNKSFAYEQQVLDWYLADEMQWWRGERKARGVEIHDTWKCRSCEFRDDCEWLQEKDQENVENVQRKRGRRKAVETPEQDAAKV